MPVYKENKKILTYGSSDSQHSIFQAAIDEFAAHGFHGARMDRIAERSSINKAMIYYHYKNKENLYIAVITYIATSIFEKIANN